MRNEATGTLGWLANRIPGARFAYAQLRRVGDALIAEARKRLDTPVVAGPAVELRQVEPLRVVMAELLERSVTDTRAQSEEFLSAGFGSVSDDL